MKTIDELLVEVDAVQTAAVAHCHITRDALRGYGRRLTRCVLGSEALEWAPGQAVRDAVDAATAAIIRVHGRMAEESLAE